MPTHRSTKKGFQETSNRLLKPRKSVLALAIATALTGSAVINPVFAVPAPLQNDAVNETVAALPNFADMIETVSPAVVNISTKTTMARKPSRGQSIPQLPPGSPMQEFFERFFEGRPGGAPNFRSPRSMQALGSGFIIDPSGYVVTNNHVIDGADEVTVVLEDGTSHKAQLQGSDPKTDLALLKIEAEEPLPYVAFGDSKGARAGDWIVAIGNPFGLGGTATTGIISARGRDIRSSAFDDYIQVDAPINQGNSGGPLFDVSGRVIGVNTAIFSPNGGNVGIGFAIPATIAKSVIDELKENGKIERGWLGVVIQPVTEDIAASLGLSESKGTLIADVMPNSPAAKAGIKPGDILTHFNGEELTRDKQLPWLVANMEANQEVKVDIVRQGEPRTLDVTIAATPNEEVSIAQADNEKDQSTGKLGLALAPITPDVRQRFQLAEETQGVVIVAVRPGSPAEAQGLQVGDVISMVGQTRVQTPQEVVDKVQEASKAEREAVLLRVARGGQEQFITLELA
jgi:serine protease Do